MYYIPDLNSNFLLVFYLVNYKYHIHFLFGNIWPTVEINDLNGYIIIYSYKENSFAINNE